jgi:hypothetical protein
MNHGNQHLQKTIEAAEKRLQKAARLMLSEATLPMWKRRTGSGAGALLLRFDPPGVLSVCCANTGQLLAASEPGQPAVLKSGFLPENYRPASNGGEPLPKR